MWGECISGALYIGDFVRLARAAGFEYPVVLHKAPIEVNDPAMRALLGNAQFCSITYRLFKLPGLLESACEDYGQVAIYKVRFRHSCMQNVQNMLCARALQPAASFSCGAIFFCDHFRRPIWCAAEGYN